MSLIRLVLYCSYLISAVLPYFSIFNTESEPHFGCLTANLTVLPLAVMGLTHSVFLAIISIAVIIITSLVGVGLSKTKRLFILIPLGWFVVEFVFSIVFVSSNKNIFADILVFLLLVMYAYLNRKDNMDIKDTIGEKLQKSSYS